MAQKLDNEPRLQGEHSRVIEWARKVVGVANGLVDAIGSARTGTSDITTTLDGPAFRAYNSTDFLTAPQNANTVLVLNSETYDTNNCYDTATGKFKPNVPGWYWVQGSVWFFAPGGTLANVQAFLQLNGSNFSNLSVLTPGTGAAIQHHIGGGSDLVYLNGTTDYVQLAYYGLVSAGSLTLSSVSHFSGHLARRA